MNQTHIIIFIPNIQDANGDGLISEANKPGDYVSHISVEDKDSGDNGHVTLKVLHQELTD